MALQQTMAECYITKAVTSSQIVSLEGNPNPETSFFTLRAETKFIVERHDISS